MPGVARLVKSVRDLGQVRVVGDLDPACLTKVVCGNLSPVWPNLWNFWRKACNLDPHEN